MTTQLPDRKTCRILMLSTCVACLLSGSMSWAKKPGKGTGAPSYTIVKLNDAGGAYDAGPANCVNDINDLANVVGTVRDVSSGDYVAACWFLDGETSELVLLDGAFARGINNFNEIIGADSDGNSLYWSSPTSQSVPLPPLHEDFPHTAYAINDSGVICGSAAEPVFDGDGQPVGVTSVAVVWRVTWLDGTLHIAGPVTLPTLDDRSDAYALSEADASGETSVVGCFRTAGFANTAAVEWRVRADEDGGVGVLGGPTILEIGNASADGVNNLGVSCGYAANKEARVWSGDTSTALDRGRRDYTRAMGVNDSGVVVGTGGPHSLDLDALVWPAPDARPILLAKYLPKRNAPFLALWNATAINHAGMIVGEGGDGITTFAYVAIAE